MYGPNCPENELVTGTVNKVTSVVTTTTTTTTTRFRVRWPFDDGGSGGTATPGHASLAISDLGLVGSHPGSCGWRSDSRLKCEHFPCRLRGTVRAGFPFPVQEPRDSSPGPGSGHDGHRDLGRDNLRIWGFALAGGGPTRRRRRRRGVHGLRRRAKKCPPVDSWRNGARNWPRTHPSRSPIFERTAAES